MHTDQEKYASTFQISLYYFTIFMNSVASIMIVEPY